MKARLLIGFLLTSVIIFNLEAQKPNVIVIISDDAGYADWGFQGSAVMETPNLDQLASEGTFFSHAYVTNSVCAPSRAGLLTGRYQNRFGFEYNIVTYHAAPGHTLEEVGLDPAERTIGNYMQDLGYKTAVIGKWHQGEEDHHHPNNRGFDYFYGLLSGSRPYFHTSDLPAGKKLMRNKEYDDLTEGYMTDVLTDDAINWMTARVDAGTPFFTYLSYTAVHGPFESKPEDFEHFADNCIGFNGSACDPVRQNYAAMTYSLDQNIGKLVDFLKTSGIYDNTLIFFINDNGGPDPGVVTDNGVLRGGKSTQWEGGLRVPFFMVWPGHVPPNTTYDQQVISLDILPTTLNAAGGTVTDDMKLDGTNLLPLTGDTDLKAHDYLFWRKFLVWEVAQKDDYKLMVDYNNPGDADNDTLLFNLVDDLAESTNLYTGTSDPVAADLLEKLEAWKQELVEPAWIGDEISNTQCGDEVDDMTECDNILIAYGIIPAPHETGALWDIEAEDGIITGLAEVASGCENASQGEFVKLFKDGGNGVIFEGISVPEKKNYELTIDYFQASESSVEMFVNDISIGAVVFPAANWCYQGQSAQCIMELDLEQGINKIEFKVIQDVPGPYLDRLRLVDPDFTRVPATFYISSSDGDDAFNGLDPATPYKSLEKISSVYLAPGDSVLFKAGDTFIGQFIINGSGSEDSLIVIGSYGEGEKPVLDGANADGGAYLTPIYIHNNDHIEIRDLEITNDRKTSRIGVSDALAYGIYVFNDGYEIMSDFIFKHLTFNNIFAVSTEGVDFNSIKVSGIRFQSEQNLVAGKEKHIRDVLVDSCYFEKTTRYGIFSSHAGGITGVGNDSLNRNMNYVFTNNHFLHTGGSCITPGRTFNCLVENNIFEYPGSGIDPRMANRGSGAWFWQCRNVLAQYNKIYHVRGYGDSYSMHVDFGNENVFFQYNYSEDTEGGFAEILGDNLNSVYRFNVSVNNGFSDIHGNSIWVSDFAGTDNRVKSDENYIYNNTIYVDAAYTPDILIEGKNTYVYNNIFYATGPAMIGQEVTVDIESGSAFQMSNNLFFGNVSSMFKNYDSNPVFGDPEFDAPGSSEIDGYRISATSSARSGGRTFEEPAFPMAGKGIFQNISMYPRFDLYGNPVNLQQSVPSIGAFNGDIVSVLNYKEDSPAIPGFSVHPNPVKDNIYIDYVSDTNGKVIFYINDLQGREIQKAILPVLKGRNKLEFGLSPEIRNGMYVISTLANGYVGSGIFVLSR